MCNSNGQQVSEGEWEVVVDEEEEEEAHQNQEALQIVCVWKNLIHAFLHSPSIPLTHYLSQEEISHKNAEEEEKFNI